MAVEVQFHALLTSALEGCEWSASDPGPFTPGKEPPIFVGKRLRKQEIPCRESNFGPPVRSLVTILTEESPAHYKE